jgi:Putative auto-transporter adhesin, head GIN domain
MRGLIGAGVLLAGALLVANSAAAAQLLIRDAVVEVRVIPQDRSNIEVHIQRANAKLPLTVENGIGGDVIVDGGQRYGFWKFLFGGRTTDCMTGSADHVVHVWGVGDVREDELPQIIVLTPKDARVSTSGATLGTIERSSAVRLSIAGCDQWTIANVEGALELHDSGIGIIHAGTAGSVELRSAGMSDLTTHEIANGAELHVAGMGKVHTMAVSGPIKVHIAGHADITIDGGHASDVDVHIAGSGKVNDLGTADTLEASIAGSGDINIAHVSGAVTKSIAGAGTINVGR